MILIEDTISVDIEAYSECSLKLCGAYVYSKHPSTEILCISFRDNDQEEIWVPGNPLPNWVLLHLMMGGMFSAYNAAFERLVWNNVGIRRYGFPELPLGQTTCTMAQASIMALPKKLGDAADFVGLTQQKDAAGTRLINILCKPDKNGVRNRGTKAQLESLYAYCSQDTATERELASVLPPMSDAERMVWEMDQEINDHGLLVDVDLAVAAQSMWAKFQPALDEEIQKITEGFTTGTQVAKLKDWISKELGLERPITSLDKAAIKQMLANKKLPQNVRRVLELRSELGSAALKKYKTFVNAADSVDRHVRGTLRYHGASTGRWAGYLIQPQNLIRPTIDMDQVPLAVRLTKEQDIEGMLMLFDSVSDTLGSLCRATIIAPQGKRFICSDYSGIEARMVARLAMQKDLLEDFVYKRDPYISMASRIYGVPKEKVDKGQRFFGKQTILGCSYGMGATKFKATIKALANIDITTDFANTCIHTYRNTYSNIPALWKHLGRKVINCIQHKVPVMISDMLSCRVEVDDNNRPVWLFIRLPVGREIAYYAPRLMEGKYGPEIYFTGVCNQTGKPRIEKLWGGTLLENISQGISRDIMVDGMFNLQHVGYTPVCTVHDEIILLADKDFGSYEEVAKIMSTTPKWASGLPLAVEGFESDFYWKKD